MALLSQDKVIGWLRTTSTFSTISSLSSPSCPRPQAASLLFTRWKTGGTTITGALFLRPVFLLLLVCFSAELCQINDLSINVIQERPPTLNSNSKVFLIFSSRVRDHTGVLSLMGHHGILNEEVGGTLLNASMVVSSQQLKIKKVHQTSF